MMMGVANVSLFSWVLNVCDVMSLSVQLPGAADLFSYYVDFESRRFETWEKIIPSFVYNPEVWEGCVYGPGVSMDTHISHY